ncbi:FAD-dependent oxidoreductase [Actinomadura madurae]|nr:FAD-dependent oxidoreductase [Actinomadura madurae]MCP9955502.1 FAD-dependent oxidoreductase [Actinomadura madurae]
MGGRTWTRPAPGGAVEAGGQFTGPTQDRLAALAGDLGVATFATYHVGRTRIDLAGGRLAYKRAKRLLAELERMASELPPDAPWTAAHAVEWDAPTFEDWLRGSGEPDAHGVMRMLTTAVFAAEPAELSLLHVLAYIRSAGSVDLLTEVAGGAQERRFAGGAQELAVRLAGVLGARAVRLAAPADRVRQTPDGVEVSARDLTVRARRAIVAVPPVLGGRIEYEPPLPAARAELQRRMTPGSTIKISCLYDAPFWRDEGLNGGLMRDRGPVTVTFDNSPPDGAHGVLVAFSQGDDARALARLPARRAPRGRAGGPGPVLRRTRGASVGVRGDRLDERAVDAGLLRRQLRAGRVDAVRPASARAVRPRPLGGGRDVRGLDELHGGRGAVRGTGRGRGHRRPRCPLTAGGRRPMLNLYI